jgi:predicted metal-dependent peptidase
MLTPERKLTKAKLDVMRSTLPGLRLWAGLMSIGKTTLDDTGAVATAYTDGRDEVYGAAFVERLQVPELSFVCLHEAMHKGLRHLTVWRKLFDENPQLTNAAADYVVNRMIIQADPNEAVCKFPRNPDGTRMGLYDTKYNGKSVKQVFDMLKQEQEQGGGGGGSGSGGQGFDDHGWEDAKALPAEEKAALEKEIDHALRRGEAEAKKLGGGSVNLPSEIGELLRPKIDWKQALREFITTQCASKDDTSYRRINRRFHALDLILPTAYGETLGHIVVGADLSGSMWCGTPSDVQKILSEFVGIAQAVKPQHVDLLYWDSRVVAHEEYKPGDYEHIEKSMKPRGGGGTSPSCVSTYLREKSIKPDCIVMLTDGHVGTDWGQGWHAPVLWLIVGNPKTDAAIGKTVHME